MVLLYDNTSLLQFKKFDVKKQPVQDLQNYSLGLSYTHQVRPTGQQKPNHLM